MAQVAEDRLVVGDDLRTYDVARTAEYRKQLGQEPRSAAYSLSRMFLLELARRLDLAWCIRCGAEIMPGDAYDIDHKGQWIDVDPALFWDLDNLGLSHSDCNRRAQRRHLDRVGPNGTYRCSTCRKFKPRSEFYPVRKTGGLAPNCIPCNKKRVADWKKGRRG